MCPLQTIFKILTIAFVWMIVLDSNSYAQSIVSQEKSNTYLRWNLFTGRDQLQFSKVGNKVVVKTLNNELFQKLKEELEAFKLDNPYIEKVSFIENLNENNSINAMAIEIELKNSNVEMFNFYRERDKKYVVDFWTDAQANQNTQITSVRNDAVNSQNSAVLKPQEVKEKTIAVAPKAKEKVVAAKTVLDRSPPVQAKATNNETLTNKIKADKDLSRFIINPYSEGIQSYQEIEALDEASKRPYRDFRYGATYIWDYDPVAPVFKQPVNLKTKIPESDFQVENRDFNKNEKEAHLQLTINLYRQKKWGLMYKSMKLFEQKYGATSDWEVREYLKANAILRENIEKPSPELFKNALTILTNLSERSDNYEMKKAIYKYLLSYYVEQKEPVKILQIAKTYFAGTRDNYDFEESVIPAEAMLNSLAKLGQVAQIKELIQDKTMQKAMAPQTLIAYQTYALLKEGSTEELVKLYETTRAGLTTLPDAVILYNVAEAYFRLGRFEEAQKLYNDFSKNYSYEFIASNARLRAALCNDLLDKNYDETMDLYKQAIDLSVDGQVSYEARVRYVGFRSVRKRNLDDRDRELRIFLEQGNSKATPDKNLTKLLHQVRLRTLIVDGKYKEALAYLSLIPMTAMSKIDARVFEGDGAEIVYGLIQDFYKKSEYTQVIKAWQAYKTVYLDKVAMDPYINFVVGSSYVKLGLYKGFDEIYANFVKFQDTPNRTFPIWVDRQVEQKASVLLTELSIVKDIKLGNWDLANKNSDQLAKTLPNYNKVNYYKGLVTFGQKNYKGTVENLEKFFAGQTQRIIYDASDVADLVRAYTDSIYELGNTDKFLKVSEAVLNDTNTFGIDNAYLQTIRERIAYLGIEIEAGKGKQTNFMLFEKKITDFKKANPKSTYLGRVNYLLAQSLVANEKLNEGREIYNSLINDNTVSDYIKELAKSELGLLNLREKTL